MSTQPPGIFITFEGIDGAGKSSHIDGLARAFGDEGRVVTVTREPGGTPLGEQLRAIVVNEPMDPLAEALLVFASRRDHLLGRIEPALARGEVVLCDRFTDSSFAYQGGGRGLDESILSTLEQWVQQAPAAAGLRQPDLTLWFDLPIAQAAERLAAARLPDKFESSGAAFFSRVAQAYQQRAHRFPTRICRIAAAAPQGQVWDQVLAAVRARGWLT